tara:strand:- start:711 stop:977 length:267 start_codon:yes stop_codon:yes gene_type:complete
LVPYKNYGILARMNDARKITAVLPAQLLATAQINSGASLTQTLKTALEQYNHSEWCRKLLAAQGQFKLDIDLDELRQDRQFDVHGNVL